MFANSRDRGLAALFRELTYRWQSERCAVFIPGFQQVFGSDGFAFRFRGSRGWVCASVCLRSPRSLFSSLRIRSIEIGFSDVAICGFLVSHLGISHMAIVRDPQLVKPLIVNLEI